VRVNTRISGHVHTHSCINTRMYTQSCTHMYRQTFTHTRSYTHSCTHMYRQTFIHTRSYTHSCTHMYRQTLIHTRSYTHSSQLGASSRFESQTSWVRSSCSWKVCSPTCHCSTIVTYLCTDWRISVPITCIRMWILCQSLYSSWLKCPFSWCVLPTPVVTEAEQLRVYADAMGEEQMSFRLQSEEMRGLLSRASAVITDEAFAAEKVRDTSLYISSWKIMLLHLHTAN